MKDINAACDCCNRKWIVQMTQAGHTLHLCHQHHDVLQAKRTADKHGQAADKWAAEVVKTRKHYVPTPIIAVPA